MVGSVEFSKAEREGKAPYANTFYAFACVMITNILLAKTSHAAKDKFKSDSLPLLSDESHTQRGMQTGVRGIWATSANNLILMVSFNEEKLLLSM